jgi:hypothetical protein
MSRRRRNDKSTAEAKIAELDLFTGDEQRSPQPPPVRSGPVRSGNTTLPSPPLPTSLRTVGHIMTGRVSHEDYLLLKGARVSVGELLRDYAAELRRHPRLRQIRSDIDRRMKEIRVDSRWVARQQVLARQLESAGAAIKQLRPDFRRYIDSSQTSWDHQVSWVRSRIQRIPELRDVDARVILDQLLETARSE